MQKISGYFIFISFIATFYSYFFHQSFLVWASLPLWISVVLLFNTLRNQKILYILLSLSAILLIIAKSNDFVISYSKLFSINQYLIVLLIGVGFLRLVATPKEEVNNVPYGEKAFVKTYISLHLFASTINLSALLLIADKFFHKTKKLTQLQIILLTRAFSSDAYWSPFFVAFGAAVTYTADIKLLYIIFSGICMALISFLLTYLEVRKNKNMGSFQGYPLDYQNLLLPMSLALFVLVTNHFFPSVKIIILVALFSVILALIVLPLKDGFFSFITKFIRHIDTELPKMKTEASLFLIAGFFGMSVSTILTGMGFHFPFGFYDYKVAALVLFVFIVLSLLGVHAIICISIFGPMLSGFNHTLVAITFLMGWASTISTSPFSGVNLTLQSRYEVNTKEVFKLNFPFMIKTYIFCVVILFVISNLLHL
jgi:hypothetical protein